MTATGAFDVTVLQVDQILPKGTRVTVFESIYWVFLVLGTIVSIVVIGYMLYLAWKYRDDGTREETEYDRPELGELPEGGGKGRKLALSFALSAIIVISLVLWTYAMLLYVEEGASAGGGSVSDAVESTSGEEPLTVHVEGVQFTWRYTYPDGHTNGTLVVPKGRQIQLNITSGDTIHNFGIPEFRVKADAIPGEVTRTWFVAEETGTYTAKCYELCGGGHSYMTTEVRVLEPAAYEEWVENRGTDGGANETTANETENMTAERSAAIAPPEVAP